MSRSLYCYIFAILLPVAYPDVFDRGAVRSRAHSKGLHVLPIEAQ